jgi:hypothetical protein
MLEAVFVGKENVIVRETGLVLYVISPLEIVQETVMLTNQEEYATKLTLNVLVFTHILVITVNIKIVL